MKVYITKNYDKDTFKQRYDGMKVQIEEISDELLSKFNLLGVVGPVFEVPGKNNYLCVKRMIGNGNKKELNDLLPIVSSKFKYLLCIEEIEQWEPGKFMYFTEGAFP